MNLARKLSTDILFAAAVRLANKLRNAAVIPILTKPLGLAAYGAYIQFLMVSETLAILFDFGLYGALVHLGQEEEVDLRKLYSTLFSMALILSLLPSMLMYVFASGIAQLTLGSREYQALFEIGGVFVLARVTGRLGANLLRAEMKNKQFDLFEGLRDYVSVGVIAFIVFYLGEGVETVAMGLVGIELIYSAILQMRALFMLGATRPSIEYASRSLRYSVPFSISTVASSVASRVDRLLIGSLLGADAVGIYSVAYGIGNVLQLLSEPITSSFFPEFSRLMSEGDHQTVGTYLRTGVRYFLLLALPAVAGLYFTAPWVARTLSTQMAADAAQLLVPIIALGIMFRGIDRLHVVVLFAEGRSGTVSRIHAASAILNVSLNLVLIPAVGLIGAALATVIAFIVSAIASYSAVAVSVRRSLAWQSVLRGILATSAMAVILAISPINNPVWILLIGGGSYSIALLLFGGVKSGEIKSLIRP